MAEAIVLNITNKILGELATLAAKEVVNLWGVNDELQKLRDTGETLQAKLLGAAEQYHQNREIKLWLQRLKDVLYNGQDVLEECSVEALRRELRSGNAMMKQVCTFFSSSNQLAFKSKMSRKVRAIRGKMKIIADDMKLLSEMQSTDAHLERESGVNTDKIDSFLWEEEIIGRDDDKETIVRLLVDSSVKKNVSVLAIVGIGGLGKTALAQYIYNDPRVEEHFDLKMWVCISDEFDVKIVVQKIFESAKKRRPDYVGIDQLQTHIMLQERLRREINGKKYLLILDDWNDDRDKWMRLKALLIGGARGSKIVITTRNQLVAEAACTFHLYDLASLSDGMSLDLLMRLACKEEETRNFEDKRSIGEEIVKKCFGVPLAIRTIGSLLFFKKTIAEWRYFKDHKLLEVSRKEDGVNSTFKLSYDHLPSHLKQCFAFCSLFPKGCVINKEKLMYLLMAEGFISQINGSTQHLEDIANGISWIFCLGTSSKISQKMILYT